MESKPLDMTLFTHVASESFGVGLVASSHRRRIKKPHIVIVNYFEENLENNDTLRLLSR
jgi:hypothetical protein